MENEWVAGLVVFCVFGFMIGMTIITRKQRDQIRHRKGSREEYKSVMMVLKERIKWK